MKLKNILISLFSLQILLTLVMKYFSYQGDLSPELHDRILKYFTQEDINSGIDYDRRGFFVSIIGSLLDFALAGIFVFTPISVKLEEYFRRKTGDRFYLTVFLFFVSFYLLEFIISLPFSYYFGYVIEHEFQFSNMNLGDWILFKAKSFGLGFVFGGLVVLVVAFVFKNLPRAWKYILPILSLSFGLLMSVLYPIVITPIFYDYGPIQEGSLKTKILALSQKANIQVENIYVINESKYSGHTNAYFTGWGESKKIFLYDTLIKNHTEEEVVSVLGHEIGHWVHNHQMIEIALSTLETFLLCFLLGYVFQKVKEEGLIPLKEFYSPSSLPFLFLVLSLVGTILGPFSATLSRALETQADREALVLTNDKKSFISTEIKLAKDNKSRLNPHKLEVIFEHSHPTTIERIEYAEGWK
ncbi:M48 family metallopeptidase [Leptospira licerasiae]|uniref:Peptidase, M48 family n=1 Tax=Leptospira licerasiae str. MMD4847 TaxID=1049971 RepID=A0ABN0H4W9_9LEPT|nr:M48 family metallopeptidase [Leptospira licerasiae]EIE02398.1 peptidase, M48 family [Leptospira licerasiae serovar Varillal str. VAR 010]EJZ40761.1 peptidase, M48 family [Leptospira licerasiae str. MMD4847]